MYKTNGLLHNIRNLLILGIVATFTMDLWNLVLYFTLGINLDWSLIGRWVGHTLQGDFFLYGLENASPIKYEAILGWLTHYTTGVIYGLCFLIFCYKIMHRKPNLLLAIIVAFIFIFMPFLVYQPAIGVGYFASNASDPNFIRAITISMHLSFGIGLYLGYTLLKKLGLRIPFS